MIYSLIRTNFKNMVFDDDTICQCCEFSQHADYFQTCVKCDCDFCCDCVSTEYDGGNIPEKVCPYCIDEKKEEERKIAPGKEKKRKAEEIRTIKKLRDTVKKLECENKKLRKTLQLANKKLPIKKGNK